MGEHLRAIIGSIVFLFVAPGIVGREPTLQKLSPAVVKTAEAVPSAGCI